VIGVSEIHSLLVLSCLIFIIQVPYIIL